MIRKFMLLLLCIVACSFCSCNKDSSSPLDPKHPVTITMWHNFGGTMQLTMDSLVDEFNSTVGRDEGIIVNVTAITSSSELQKSLGMIADGLPGAPVMPDITTAYPKTAILFQQEGMLCDLTDYFSEDDLTGYVPSFVEEGFIDGGLYVFPIAKSTEILYMNQTLLDGYSGGIPVKLETFEDLIAVARAYADNSAFFCADSWINLVMTLMIQQGESLFVGDEPNYDSPAFARIWNIICPAVLEGSIALYDGYSSDLSKTGDLVCSTGSSAGILFYGDTITHADGTVQQVEYSILPYPVITGGSPVAIQRGNGMMVAKNDFTKEYACARFLRWFTDAPNNMRFIASTGYLPVTREAFETSMEKELDTVQDPRIQKVLSTVRDMYRSYQFFVAPTFDTYDSFSKQFDKDFKRFLRSYDQYLTNEQRMLSTEEQSAILLEVWKEQW